MEGLDYPSYLYQQPETIAPSGVVMPNQTAPQFLLLTQTQSDPVPSYQGGVWKFVLEQIGSSYRIEASEDEPGFWGERLQLLAVVRGLEALAQPSRVTLITPSRFVGNGIRRGLASWREQGWQWENFGQMTPIKNCDLWKRVDQALQYHQINCRIWDFDEPHSRHARPAARNRISFGEIQEARKISSETNKTANSAQVAISIGAQTSPISHSGMDKFVNGQSIGFENGSNAIKRQRTDAAGHRKMLYLADRVKPVGQGRAFGYVPN